MTSIDSTPKYSSTPGPSTSTASPQPLNLSDAESFTKLTPTPVHPTRKRINFFNESDDDDNYDAHASVDKSPSSVHEDLTTSEIVEKVEINETKYIASKKRKVVKTKDDEIPLPDPFELPKNYRPDVEDALKNRQMTMTSTREFLSRVAAAMFVIKKYPSQDDYMNVARSICNKYPFMKAPTGKPYVSSTCLTILCVQFYSLPLGCNYNTASK